MAAVSETLASLTLEEKVALCAGDTLWSVGGVHRLGVPSMVLTDGPHGVRLQEGDPADPTSLQHNEPSTCFPTASALAATWDVALLEEVGVALGEEARSKGVSVLLGPGANLKRTPLCGRNFEYFSEDPFLSSRLAAAWIRGVQQMGVAASLKHLAANNQELRRAYIDARLDDRALRELYLASFEHAVTEGKPWTVMAAYNRLEGTWCAQHRWLLTEVLRQQWGFDGVVLSDWGAIDDRAEALRAGCDLEMPGFAGRRDPELLEEVRSGRVPLAVLDAAVLRILQLVERTAPARVPHPYDREAHHALALRVAAEGTVLLKNDGGLLPVSPSANIAVIGAFAETPRYQGAGSSEITPTRLEDALGALRAKVTAAGGRLTFARGYGRQAEDSDPALLSEALEGARGADVVLVFVGLTEAYETEGRDRRHLRLPPAHEALVRKLAAVHPRLVVVLSNGAPVEMPWHGHVPAIVEAYLGGQAGGAAVASVLLGELEPGGRLAETFPHELEDHPVTAMPTGPAVLEYRESIYVGYRYFDAADVNVLFPFGHGLSYTTFAYSDLEVSEQHVSVTVTNTGPRAGSEVVQLYVHAATGGTFRPPRELKGFAKVRLAAGESRRVQLGLDDRTFAIWDAARGAWVVEEGTYELHVGSSSRDIRAVGRVASEGGKHEPSEPGPAAYRPGGFDREAFAALYGRALPENVPEPWGSYTLNTPLADMRASPVARLLHDRLFIEASRALGRKREDLPPVVLSMLEEASLRSLWLMSQGRLRRPALQALLDLTNGRWLRGSLAMVRALFRRSR
jgi:beta-glucosidase